MEEIRLQKFLADCGVASRRKAEKMIVQGRVSVNGIVADKLGTKVSVDDTVTVDGRAVSLSNKKIYMLLNKPSGYVTTVSDECGRKTVIDLVKDEVKERVYPVGRLDFETEGLLLLTNDGDVAYALTHPKHHIPKTYIAVLDSVPSPASVEKLRRGVIIDGRKTAPSKVEWLKDNIIKIMIHEGRNRQIRKMAEAVGHSVVSLKRISIGEINLGNIPLGRWRHLTKTELEYLKKQVSE
ncbi:MAG: Ribosomal large subunit pseudouridine synthase B [Firmicutes bacterium ADurb.Bin193]|nr:MAG: Ribosomal large subunit pseudouridine synthase B [Firmicutes bacterium ADurb.Bin193]